MEEFKKPSFPSVPIKSETPGEAVKSSEENCERTRESGDLEKALNPYKIPQWSDKPIDESNYSFEVLKSGQIIDEVKNLQQKAYWSFGRLPENDIEMAHPTISRFHAILQYRPKCTKTSNGKPQEEDKKEQLQHSIERDGPPGGWYIYDLESTHGTFLNKQRIPPKVYIRIKVGHLLRLGASTRSYILQGPTEDKEPESELSITELKAKRKQEIEEAATEKRRLADEAIERAKNECCSWGMADDADEESDLAHNPYAVSNNEELFLDDPKKTLRGYFEREGAELLYKCDEMSAGSFVCRVELPIDDGNGRSVVAEVVHKGKKKDCVLQCALEACRILDRHGVLRQANQEPLKRKQKLNTSDSDDDDFWDRTGDVARKKQRKAEANTSVTLTYEDLLKQENIIDEKIKQIQNKITKYHEQQERVKSQKANEGEDLDAFMESLQEKEMKIDKTEIRKLRIEEQRLKAEKQKLQRLLKIAKPINLPSNLQPTEKRSVPDQSKGKQLPIIGKRNQFNKFKILKVQPSKDKKPVKLLNSDEEEEEDEEPEVQKQKDLSLSSEIQIDNFVSESIIENTEENVEHVKEYASTETRSDTDSKGITGLGISERSAENKEVGSSNKKRQQRIRQRGRREEVDMNDDGDYESSEKYDKWLPPENQTGDGLTELNKKFGY